MKEPDAGDVFFGVVSIGLTCFEEQLSACGESRVTTTGSDGSFSYNLKGSETQGKFGNASILELTTLLPHQADELAGPGVSTRFQVQTEHVSVPLRIWEPKVTITGEGPFMAVKWTEPAPTIFPAEANLGAMHRWVVFEDSDGTEVWKVLGGPGRADLEPEFLEDTRGGATVFATIGDIKTPPARGTDVEVLARSARYGYASPAGPPPSRGKPCTVPDAEGRPVVPSPCAVTDGRFKDSFVVRTCPADAKSCTEPVHKQMTIDLERQVAVAIVIVRGCAGACAIDTSPDGKLWNHVGGNSTNEVGARDVGIPTGVPKAARYVRLTSANGLSDLREVSVWDHRPRNLHGSFVIAPSSVPNGKLTNGPKSSSKRPLLTALVIVGAVVIAVGAFLIGRRRGAKAPRTETTSRGKT
jgi:hypothetical protein